MNSTIILISRLRLLITWTLLVLIFFTPFYFLPKPIPDLIILPTAIAFGVLFFTIPFKIAQYRLKVNFSYDSLTIENEEYKWSEVKSYKAEYSQYLEVLTIKLKTGKKIRLTGLTDGKKSKEFQKLKDRFIDLVELHNRRNETSQIQETGFYTTGFAKIYIVIMSLIALFGVFAFFLGERKNPVPLLMILGLLGVMIPQIFKKRKTKANKK